MKINLLIRLLVLTSLLVGCVSFEVDPIVRGSVVLKDLNNPSIDEVKTVGMGDRMMHQKYGWDRDCLTTSVVKATPVTSLFPYTILTGIYCSAGIGSNYFSSVDPAMTFSKVDKGSGDIELCPYGMKPCLSYMNNEYSMSTEFASSEEDLQQTIEYMGRNGNLLEFIYAEFKGGYARQAFNRSFTVNLDQGNILQYKGCIVEIINASNTQITYKIKKYFNK